MKSKRRHWLAVTLSFTPCGDRQTDFYGDMEIRRYGSPYVYISPFGDRQTDFSYFIIRQI